jgi:hypothetical protein
MNTTDKNCTNLSPDCIKIWSHSKTPGSLSYPPVIKKKYEKKPKLFLKKFPLVETQAIALSSIRKCIKVNSILNSTASGNKTNRSVIMPYKNSSYNEEFINENAEFPECKSKNRINYYRIRHDVIPQTNAMNKKTSAEFNLSLKGSQITN